MKITKDTFILLFLVTQFCLAEPANLSKENEVYDNANLIELVQEGKRISDAGESCRQSGYVNNVKLFYLSAIDFYEFISEAERAHHLERSTYSTGNKRSLELNSCFAEASLMAVIPEVNTALSFIRKNPESGMRVAGTLVANWEILKQPADLALLRTSKMAASMYSIFSLGHIAACNFKQDPFLYLSALDRLQMLFHVVYRTKDILNFIAFDECAIDAMNAHPNDYNQVSQKKAIQYFGQ